MSNGTLTVRQKQILRRNDITSSVGHTLRLGLHTHETLYLDLYEIDPDWWPLAPRKHFQNEIYGPMAMCYVECRKDFRPLMTEYLELSRHVINNAFWPGQDIIEVQVAWFPGYHWDE